MAKAAEAFRTISEVADDLGIQKHVLRFWEVKFTQIRPMKRGGGRRYYRPEDMELLRGIRQLLHRDGYTIKGVQKVLREQGVEAVKDRARSEEEKRLAAAASAAVAAATPEAPARGAAEPPAQPVGRRARGSARKAEAPVVDTRKVLDSVIAELISCRALLEETQTRAAKPRRAARRSA
jgi:DNA-binding transcriptional MerR regulator